MTQTFDYTNGCAIVQDGVIYYSPNCTRSVVIPSCTVFTFDPFRQPRLNSAMFRQPVWRSDGWAWLSFVPLVPSFTFTPFEPLCAMPCIEEVKFSFVGPSGERKRETRFRMNEVDLQSWVKEAKLIVWVARVIQLRYGIPGNLPPKPLSFHFDHAHKTHQIAKRMICISQEWFAIWMGFISYLIAKSVSRVLNGKKDTSSPWFAHSTWEHRELGLSINGQRRTGSVNQLIGITVLFHSIWQGAWCVMGLPKF